jgi:PAS domain S-box-containing protein
MEKLSLFVTPAFEDTQNNRIKNLLYGVAFFTIFTFILFGIIGVLLVPENGIRPLNTALYVTIACLVVVFLTSRDKLYSASVLFVIQFWLITTLLAASRGGVLALAVSFYPIVILAAGLLLGWKHGLFTAVFCILTEISLAIAVYYGLVPPLALQNSIFHNLRVHAMEAFIIIIFVYYYTKSIEKLLRSYEKASVEKAESEQQLRSLFAAMSDIVMVFDKDGIFLQMAPTSPVRIYQPEVNRIGKTVYEIFPQNVADIFHKNITLTLKEKKLINVEYSIPFPDQLVWFNGRVSPFTEDSVIWLARDITDQKESQKQLEMFQATIDSSPDAAYWMDAEGRFVYVNVIGCDRLGYSLGELLNMKVFDISPTDTPERWSQVWEILRTQGNYVSESVHRRKDSSQFPVEISSNYFKFNDKEYVNGFARDLTEQKKSAALIKENEIRYKELIETAQDIIFTLSVDGTIITTNQAFEVIQGFPADEWLGKTFTGLIHPSDLSLSQEIFEKVLSGSAVLPTELRVLTKAGNYKTIELNAVPQSREGKVVGVLGISRDVTARKQLEEQLRRTQRLESLGALAGGIAHDLNNVLSPIMMSLEIFRMRLTEPKLLKILESLGSSLNRGKDLVKQILVFARGAGDEFAPQNLRLHLDEMKGLIKETFPKNLSLQLNISDELPAVMGDSTQLHQVLLNLCVNARDAMPDGGKLLINASSVYLDEAAAKLIPLEKAGKYVVISVSDNGEGIPVEIQEKLFEPFFTTKEVGKGTGLGLSTVHTIIKEHKGIIKLFSKVGEGTEFRIYLPALIEQETKIEVAKQKLPSGNGELVLVVDDEKSILNMAREILETYGYSVKTAMNGADALLSISDMQPNEIKVIITDINMPRIDGFDTIKLIRNSNPGIKILVVSGSVDNMDKMESMGLNVQGFLAKPYNSSQLLNTLYKTLNI